MQQPGHLRHKQPSVKLVPADENALRRVSAWGNQESVYLLVL